MKRGKIILLLLALFIVDFASGQGMNDINSLLENSMEHFLSHYCDEGKEVLFWIRGNHYDIIKIDSLHTVKEEGYVIDYPWDEKDLKKGKCYWFVGVQLSIERDKLCFNFSTQQLKKVKRGKLICETNGWVKYVYQYSSEKSSWLLIEASAHWI